MDIQAKVFVWTYVYIFPGYITGSGIAGSCGECMLCFLRNYELYSKNVSSSLHFEDIIPLPLTSIISKKSDFSRFSLCFQDFLFVFDFEKFDYDVFRSEFLSVLPAWLSLTSLDRNVQVSMLS